MLLFDSRKLKVSNFYFPYVISVCYDFNVALRLRYKQRSRALVLLQSIFLMTAFNGYVGCFMINLYYLATDLLRLNKKFIYI